MKRVLLSFILLTLGAVILSSCSSTTDTKEQEYIATLDDFKGYTSWTKVDTKFGPDPLLSSAHGVTDSLYRNVYVKDNQKASNGKYPTGTIVLKELQDNMGNVTGALTVMVKRGANFNPDGNGWEWFMTDVNLTTVLTQGDNATAGDGMYATCHAGANANNNGTDWVFNHGE